MLDGDEGELLDRVRLLADDRRERLLEGELLAELVSRDKIWLWV